MILLFIGLFTLALWRNISYYKSIHDRKPIEISLIGWKLG